MREALATVIFVVLAAVLFLGPTETGREIGSFVKAFNDAVQGRTNSESVK